MAKLKYKEKEVLDKHEMFDPKTETNKTDNDLFEVMTANEVMDIASKIEVPQMLFSEFIFEGELTVLFAPMNVGKTILGVQIADSITRGKAIEGFRNQAPPKIVCYFDLELSKKQFQGRYVKRLTETEWIDNYIWDDKMHIVSFKNMTKPKDVKWIDFVFQGILKMVNKTKAEVIFIDNISWLSIQGLEASKDAGELMKRLDELKKKHKLTIVALAHTPKKKKWESMSRNDLAGSAVIGNFIDSLFTINHSRFEDDEHSRYLKQLKARSVEVIYHSGNVVTVKTCKVHQNFTGIERIQHESLNDPYYYEDEHLAKSKVAETVVYSEETKKDLKLKLVEVVKDNPEITARALAEEVGIGKDAALRWKKELFDNYGK